MYRECAQGCGTSTNVGMEEKLRGRKILLGDLGGEFTEEWAGERMMEPQGTNQIALTSVLEALLGELGGSHLSLLLRNSHLSPEALSLLRSVTKASRCPKNVISIHP